MDATQLRRSIGCWQTRTWTTYKLITPRAVATRHGSYAPECRQRRALAAQRANPTPAPRRACGSAVGSGTGQTQQQCLESCCANPATSASVHRKQSGHRQYALTLVSGMPEVLIDAKC